MLKMLVKANVILGNELLLWSSCHSSQFEKTYDEKQVDASIKETDAERKVKVTKHTSCRTGCDEHLGCFQHHTQILDRAVREEFYLQKHHFF